MWRLYLQFWEFWFTQEQSRDGTLANSCEWTAWLRQQVSFDFVGSPHFLFLLFPREVMFYKSKNKYKPDKLNLRHRVCNGCYKCDDFLDTHFFLVVGNFLVSVLTEKQASNPSLLRASHWRSINFILLFVSLRNHLNAPYQTCHTLWYFLYFSCSNSIKSSPFFYVSSTNLLEC